MDLYAQNILDRYKNPYYLDKKIDADIRHKETNHSCGDSVEVSIQVNEDGKITGYSFSGVGCAISMASADMLGDLVSELEKDEVLDLKKEDIYRMLGIEISLRRSKCALLALLALQNGILKRRKMEPKSWSDFHL
ncbi:MAG: iron-sulfur cluster assembly scaffold protein [Patescibacteria group bacterium]